MLYETVNVMEEKKPIHVVLSCILSFVILFPHFFSVSSSVGSLLDELFDDYNSTVTTQVASVDRSSFGKSNSIVKVNITTGIDDEDYEDSEHSTDSYEGEYVEGVESSLDTEYSDGTDDSYDTEGSYDSVIPNGTVATMSPIFGWQTDGSDYKVSVEDYYGENGSYTAGKWAESSVANSFVTMYDSYKVPTSLKSYTDSAKVVAYAYTAPTVLSTSVINANATTLYSASSYVNGMLRCLWLGPTNFFKKFMADNEIGKSPDKSPDKKPENPMELLKKAILNDSLAESDNEMEEEEPEYRRRKQEL